MLPVNRKEELNSRVNYYYNWARELIEQESDIFTYEKEDENLTEDQVMRYFHFLRDGEEKRIFVLQKYGYKDPCSNLSCVNDIDELEKSMMNLIRYQNRHQTTDYTFYESDNSIFNDDDDDDDDDFL